MKELLSTAKRELGGLGIASAALLVLVVAFAIAYVKPLEAHRARLERQVEQERRPALRDGLVQVRSAPAPRMDDFYRFFERKERTDEWLAKLYGIASASGLELRAAAYRLDGAKHRFERYQVNLPVTGSYAQVRRFLEASLAEIPVMSLDQVSFRRKGANDPRVEAEIVLTLHLLAR